MMSFPDILLAIALVAALGPSLPTVIIALGITYAPRLARIVRGSTLVLREMPYIEAAITLGLPTWKVLSRHLLLNLASPILVQATFVFASAMLAEASLSFLGPGSAFWTLIVVETLQWTPFAFLLFYMAYQAIPREIIEASQMDGALYRHRLWYIELPLMAPTIVVALLIRFIDGFRVFDNVYVLTGSGPGGSTASLSIYIYEAFFKQGAIGKAVAASVILFVASFAVLYGLNAIAARRKGAAR